jgi:hypothetical protein
MIHFILRREPGYSLAVSEDFLAALQPHTIETFLAKSRIAEKFAGAVRRLRITRGTGAGWIVEEAKE